MYALTVQPPTAVQQAIVGDFAGTKQQQILVASGSRLTLLEVSRAANGSLREIHSHDVFGIIRKVAPFRLTGATKGLYRLFLSFTFSCPLLPFFRNSLVVPAILKYLPPSSASLPQIV